MQYLTLLRITTGKPGITTNHQLDQDLRTVHVDCQHLCQCLDKRTIQSRNIHRKEERGSAELHGNYDKLGIFILGLPLLLAASVSMHSAVIVIC